VSTGTFAAFSKFHLNTSNSPNTKVVCFVEGHNYHVEWNLKFGVEMCEKCRLTPVGTVHWSREFLHLGIQFVHQWLKKGPMPFYESCRAMQDLQLWYSKVCLLQFKNFEKNPPELGYPELCGAGTRARATSRSVLPAPRPYAAVRARRGRPEPIGANRHPCPFPSRHAPHARRLAAPTCAARPMASAPYSASPCCPRCPCLDPWLTCVWVVNPSPRHERL
jgi:hypothetical protein